MNKHSNITILKSKQALVVKFMMATQVKSLNLALYKTDYR